MKHLFKLKHDGKTVGYERFVYCDQREGYLKGKSLVPQHSVNGISWEHIYEWVLNTSPKGYWFKALLDMDVYIEHDEKYPFVIKDKNGKDVFAGDKATAIVWMEDLANHRIEGEIIYYNCGYCIQTTSTYYHLNDLKDIELIEDS